MLSFLTNLFCNLLVLQELGAPIDVLFSEFSDEPIAAASLAQVYRARLRGTGQEVAVKVQRPGALGTISKDLYVMRRAVGVYEQLVKRFTAQVGLTVSLYLVPSLHRCVFACTALHVGFRGGHSPMVGE